MSVAMPDLPQAQLEIARQHVEHALGPNIAKRLDTFRDGTFHVTPSGWALLVSWLVDVGVVLLLAGGGFLAFVLAKPDAGDNAMVFTAAGLLFGVPIVYGLFFGNGRAVGAVLTGTRLVRLENGNRIGAGACWAMLVRTVLFPMLIAAMIVGMSNVSGDLTRTSIDADATRRLHAAGFLRLPVS